MNTTWVIIKDSEIYAVADCRHTAYKIMRQSISNPAAISFLKASYENWGQRISVNKNFYAEEWGITKLNEVK